MVLLLQTWRVLCQSFSGFVATDVEGLVSEL